MSSEDIKEFWDDFPIKQNSIELKQKEHEEDDNKVIKAVLNKHRIYNIGDSDYSIHKIQPWDIWIEYKLNPWDADIIKRVLRNKIGENRKTEYEKIIHICNERIRHIDNNIQI